jgi:hypothetical protein
MLRITLPRLRHHAAAFVEIGNRHADRANVDGVVCDHRALEREFRVERDFADVADAVACDLDIDAELPRTAE